VTPTDTIIALEKALEAGPEPITTDLYGDRYFMGDYSSAQLSSAQDKFFTACSPLAIRTLLDAHASALRDAARLDWLVSQLSDRDFREFGLTYRCGDDSIRGAIDSKLAALDDNTKGAAA
jgi:hypothetical protein